MENFFAWVSILIAIMTVYAFVSYVVNKYEGE